MGDTLAPKQVFNRVCVHKDSLSMYSGVVGNTNGTKTTYSMVPCCSGSHWMCESEVANGDCAL